MHLTSDLDVSDRYSTNCTLATGNGGEVEGRVRTTPEVLRDYFAGRKP